ncbi:MAG: DUF975 family protein [Clostridiales Family XIII bacterium]|nr:DUF975 family protein [Clostridiales Family XIII bacterium]
MSVTDTIIFDEAVLKEIEKHTKGTPIAVVVHRVTSGVESFRDATSLGKSSRAGVISDVYRSSVKAGGPSSALVSRLNRAAFGGKLGSGAVAIFGYVLTILFKIFVVGVINIGLCRLFLEIRLYPDTPLTRILFIYKDRQVLNAALIVFMKYLQLFLWMFTVVGLPIKYYSYYLVPFITAETPGIPYRQAFRLSEGMMRGYKFRVFLFDLSFLGWLLLSIFTFGLLNYLWLNPYMRAARAELYAELRALAKSNDIEGAELANDALLFELSASAPPDGCMEGVYPVPATGRRSAAIRRWLVIGAKESYSYLNLALMFFLFSGIGWIWECSLILIKYGVFVNRGTLYGPWIPIYGCGGVAVILILNRLNRKPIICFFSAMLVCGAIEYVGATLLWNTHHLKYWDYSGYFFNIQGRVCLEGLLAFGILCMVGMYFIAPLTDNLLNRVPLHIRKLTLLGLAAAIGMDYAFSQVHPHIGPGITSDIK